MKTTKNPAALLLVATLLLYCDWITASPLNTKKLSLTLNDSDRGILVEITFVGDHDGTTEIEFSDWGGLEHKQGAFLELEAKNSRGIPLVVDQHKERTVSIWHIPNEKVSVRYFLENNARQDKSSSRDYFRPVVNQQTIQLIGHSTLLLPRHYQGDFELDFCWQNIKRPTIFSSLSLDKPCIRQNITRDRLYGALFVTGDFYIEKVNIAGEPLYITLEKFDWLFTFEYFVEIATRVTQAERDYFGDYDFPFYWINAIRVGQPVSSGYSFAGTRLANNFTLFLSPSSVFEEDYVTGSPMIHVLAHEMMHEWTGGKLQADASVTEGEFYWFTEGFTNYLTKRVMLSSGFLSEKQFVASINENLVNYFDNPAKNASNAAIAEKFWQSTDYQKLPYQRGEIIAWAIDTLLQPHSSIKAVFKEWLKRPHFASRLTLDSFIHELASQLNSTELMIVQSAIEEGIDHRIAELINNNCQQLSEVDLPTWDVGFDIDQSIAKKAVVGLKKGSNAYLAGLREGQKVEQLSLEYNQLGKPVKISIENMTKPIEYYPYGESKRYWQLSLKQDNCLVH